MRIDIIPPWTLCPRCDYVYGQEHHCHEGFRLSQTDLRLCGGCGALIAEPTYYDHQLYECDERREALRSAERSKAEEGLLAEITKLDEVIQSFPGVPVTVYIDYYHEIPEDGRFSGSARIEGKGRSLFEAMHDAYRAARPYIRMIENGK